MPRGPHTSFLSSHYTFSAQHPTISVPKSCKASEAGPTLNIGVFSCKAFKNQHLLLEPRLLAQIAACVQCCFQRGPADKPEKLYSVFLRMGSNNYLVHTSKVTITWICLTNLEKKKGGRQRILRLGYLPRAVINHFRSFSLEALRSVYCMLFGGNYRHWIFFS